MNVKRLVCILDRKEQKLRRKTIPLVRVQWKEGAPGESTWELEDAMRKKHPELFNL